MNGLKSYKISSLDEKRTILSTLFSAYKELGEYNLDFASYQIHNAASLWGASKDKAVLHLLELIDNRDIGLAKEFLYEMINRLINEFAPSKENG